MPRMMTLNIQSNLLENVTYFRSNDAQYTCHGLELWTRNGPKTILHLTMTDQSARSHPHRKCKSERRNHTEVGQNTFIHLPWLRREIFTVTPKDKQSHTPFMRSQCHCARSRCMRWQLWAMSFIFFAGVCHFLFLKSIYFWHFRSFWIRLCVCVQWQRQCAHMRANDA